MRLGCLGLVWVLLVVCEFCSRLHKANEEIASRPVAPHQAPPAAAGDTTSVREPALRLSLARYATSSDDLWHALKDLRTTTTALRQERGRALSAMQGETAHV